MTEETRLILDEIGRLDEKVGRLDEKVGSMNEKIGSMDKEIGRLDEKIVQLNEKMDTGFGEVNSQMAVMQDELQMVKLRIENEISPNIKRVAEGHLDLSRNLHDAMTPSNEVEMLSIRVGMLESEVRAIKQKIS